MKKTFSQYTLYKKFLFCCCPHLYYRAIDIFLQNYKMVTEQLYIFSLLNIFITIYAIFNFYCDIFLLVHAEQGLKYFIILAIFAL